MDDDEEECRDVDSLSSALTPVTVINLSTGSSLNMQQVDRYPELVALAKASGMRVSESSISSSPSHSHSDDVGSKDSNSGLHLLTFVCCHAQRDARCGNRGPKMMSAVEQWAQQQQQQQYDGKRTDEKQRQGPSTIKSATPTTVTILPCSHLGGHEFAPNIMLYAWKTHGNNGNGSDSGEATLHQSHLDIDRPSVLSDWFGLMSTDQLSTLMDEYRNYAINALHPSPSSSSSPSIPITDVCRRLLRHELPKPSSTSTDTATCPVYEGAPDSASSPSESPHP